MRRLLILAILAAALLFAGLVISSLTSGPNSPLFIHNPYVDP
jgi:hypothetical protein